jgi:6-pyruvoyltetrahydropterin/6-carboxytetrahydropterin synthase
MYTMGVKRDFVAQHFLVGGDWGAENLRHSHHYQVEVQLEGKELDGHGYLVDIVEVEKHLQTQVDYFRDRMLNELPEFAGRNPSIEHLARIICQSMAEKIGAANLSAVRVKVWENDIAWAAYREEL